jgi:hypothetical protein
MIQETITFKFETEDQQKRFHARLEARPGLTVTYEQALRDLRDYFREMSELRKRESDATKNAEYSFAKASEADAYEHAMNMTEAYLGEKRSET